MCSDVAFVFGGPVARSVEKFRGVGGQSQSGQAIKLFQITPYGVYAYDFQTLNNPGS